MLIWTAALAALAIAGSPAARLPLPPRFYNQPGATLALLDRELARCRLIAQGSTGETVEHRPLAPPLLPGGGASITQATTDAIEDCMRSRGWRLYALSDAERRAIAARSPATRARIRARLTAAQSPAYGRLVLTAAPTMLQLPGASGIR